MATKTPDLSFIMRAAQGGWTPAIQIELEKSLTTEQITASRNALTAAQKTLLNKYLELTQTKAVPKTSIRIIDKSTAKAEALHEKYESEKKTAEEEYKKKVKELQATTATEEDTIKETAEKKLAEIDTKIRSATPQEQPALYLLKEQLKEERDADLRELAQENVQELKDLEAELKRERGQIEREKELDEAELAPEEIKALIILDIKENGWTPEKQLDLEEGLSFEEWGEARKKLTGDQVYEIEAYTQGLTPAGWTPEGQLQKEEGMTWAEWGEERRKLTGDQIEDIEAYTQGLEIPSEAPETEVSGERLTAERQTEEERAMSEADRIAARRSAEGTQAPELPSTPQTTQPTPPAPELIIQRTNYPKWWKDLEVAKISLSDAGTQTVIPGRQGFRTFIASITFFVSDETNIVLTFGMFGLSGSMDFGGENEPRGITANMGDSPAPCGQGGFAITSDGSGTSVGGFVVYYSEPEK